MACALNQAIADFVAGITRGPFKCLYCLEDFREDHRSHFTCCHMPLDGYTLAWYKRE